MTYTFKKTCYIILLAVFSSICGKAQKIQRDTSGALVLDLNQVWERLMTYSTSIQIKKIQEKNSNEGIKEAIADRLPDIDVEGEYARVSNMPVYEDGIFNTPRQFPVLHAYYKAGGNAYFNLYNGNRTNLEISKRKTELRISHEQKGMTVSEMKLKSAAYYLDMQRSLIFRDFLLKDIAAQQTQLAQIKTFLENGVVLKSDVLRAELRLSKLGLALVQLDNDLDIANQKLNTLIGLPDKQKVRPVETMDSDSISIGEYEEYLAYALDSAYQIRVSDQERELSRLNLKSVKAHVLPKVGLFANYSYSYPQIFLYPYSANLYGFGMMGIKASFSIASIYRNPHKSEMAKLDYELKGQEIIRVRDEVRDNVNEAYLRFKEAITRINVTRINVGQATENRRIVGNTYFNHLSLITDLLDADTQLLQTHFDLAAAKIAARFQYFQLLSIIGKL